MKKRAIKTLLISMSICMSLVFGGCGKKEEAKESESQVVSSESVESTEEVTEESKETEEQTEESAEVVEETSVEALKEPEPTPEPEEEITPVEPFTLYLTGIDVWGWVGKTSRSDVNIILSVNPQTHQILMVSTPRDFYVPLSISQGAKDKLTHAGLYGTQCSVDTLSLLYGVDLDYYFRVNFSGFEAIVNALGGITVWTDYDFTVDPIKHYVKGENDLTGLEALAFVRERHSFKAGDRVRGIHQMATVKAVFEKVVYSTLLDNYAQLAQDLSEFYETSMPFETLEALVKMQKKENCTWDLATYSADGNGSSGVTYSGGSKALSVIEPNMNTVNKAAELIKAVQDGKLLSEIMDQE